MTDWRKELERALRQSTFSDDSSMTPALKEIFLRIGSDMSQTPEALVFVQAPEHSHYTYEPGSPELMYVARILRGDHPVAKVTDEARASGEFINGAAITQLVQRQIESRIDKAHEVKYLCIPVIQGSWGGKSSIAQQSLATWVFTRMRDLDKTMNASIHFVMCLIKAFDDWLVGELASSPRTPMSDTEFLDMLSRWKSYQRSNEYDERVHDYLIEMPETNPDDSALDELTKSVKSKLDTIASLLPGSHDFNCKAKLILFFDEAHFLIKEKLVTPTLFQILRKGLQFLPKEEPYVIAIFAGTHSNLANFLEVADPAAKMSKVFNQLVCDPICSVSVLDVWVTAQACSIAECCAPYKYSQFGRAALHSFFKDLANDPLACSILAHKVLAQVEAKIFSQDNLMGLLSFRFPLSFKPTSVLVLKRFASMFTLAHKVNNENTSIILLHGVEPLIALASRRITSRDKLVLKSALENLGEIVHGGLDIDAGSIGEVLALFLITLISDQLAESEFTRDLAEQVRQSGVDPSSSILPFKLVDLIKLITGEKDFAKIQTVVTKTDSSVAHPGNKAVNRISRVLAKDVMRLISMNRFDHKAADIDAKFLLNQFIRGVGIAHRTNFPYTDTTFPILRLKDFKNPLMQIPEEPKIGCIQLQIKNHSGKKSAAYYEKVLEKMLKALPNVHQDRYYLLWVLDLGPKGVQRCTHRFILSNPNVIALATVGLKPSDIVGHTLYDDLFQDMRPNCSDSDDEVEVEEIAPNQYA